MGSTRPSMQELIERRKRGGFIGRRAEIDRFRTNFDVPLDDERHSFVFHIHGMAGVGKSSLLQELRQVATQRQAITATLDETVNSVPEAMAAISAQFAAQGFELKALDKMLSTYRQRRHEAELASAAAEPGAGAASPSAGSMAVAQAGLIGLGMVPGVGAFAGAVDPAQVAHQADRLRAAISPRLRDHDDVQLVLEPVKVLSPVFVTELNRLAGAKPWIVLFFDTYERTAPFLDAWLADVIVSGRYGSPPGNAVFALAGQHGPDPSCWRDFTGYMTEYALDPFTESEVRQLLASKGVVEEQVVRDVLELSDCLPVLVKTLAEHAHNDPGTVSDPAATAVERFLWWEQDPGLRKAALACAFPRRLDEDVFRAVVDAEAVASYTWLRGLPFASDRAGRVLYHDVVRKMMLRLQRTRSPHRWSARHEHLAQTYGQWRAEIADGRGPDELWADEVWRELRAEEAYHDLCARPRAAVPDVLGDIVDACRADAAAVRVCAQALCDAGEQTETEETAAWGRELLSALTEEANGVLAALGVLLEGGGLSMPRRAEAHCIRAQLLRRSREYERALAECHRAVALDSDSATAHYERGVTLSILGDQTAALAALDRADQLRPDDRAILFERGDVLQELERHEDALAVFDHMLLLDQVDAVAWACRAYSKHVLGDDDEALAGFGRSLEINDKYLWALVHRAEVYRSLARLDESFADLDRAVEISADSAWIASERGDAYRLVGRYEDAVEELGRACALEPEHASAHAGRGYALAALHRVEEARTAFDRAVEIDPDYAWALVQRAQLRQGTGDERGRWADLDRAVEADGGVWALSVRGIAHWEEDQNAESLADYDLALERDADNGRLRALRGSVLMDLGRDTEAYAEFDRAVELGHDHADVLTRRSRAHRKRWRFREALQDVEEALSVEPDRASLHNDRAEVHIAVGDLSSARVSLDRCVAAEAGNAYAHSRIVDVLTLSGRYDEALQVLDAHRVMLSQYDAVEAARQLWFAEALAGRWRRARREAEWLYVTDIRYGAHTMAMAVGLQDGASDAEPLWDEARRRGPQAGTAAYRNLELALVSWGRGRWTVGDQLYAEGISLYPDWEDLTNLLDGLVLLARFPGVEYALLGPRLSRVAGERDLFRARHG
ncbi:tetratricopeptide repeat protein [Streptomyces chartreusis]|uniref:tetratricopeptide repeat protein n=1 Tax=Streptomyces chartreusis TaxID=1969 RepID=UPI0035D5AF3B